MDLSGQRVLVVGLGASGLAAARLCLQRGASVTATDAKPRSVFSPALATEVARLEASGARTVLGTHDGAGFDRSDLIVVSPGVADFVALRAAEAAGVPVIGEVELAVRALRHPAEIFAVGGTNGKSTTTTLLGALLASAGRRTFTGGNLGEPLAARADEVWDAIVLEVSSFQLERAPTFRPRVSALLNITDDHLDRYATFDDYAHAKGNAFAQQREGDVAIVPVGDPICERQARRGAGALVTFGRGGTVDVSDDAIVDRPHGETYPRALLRVEGEHNAMNAAAAIAAASASGVPASVIRSVLSEFRGLPHRTALVAEIEGVRFYDDSKGTNVGASVTALRGLREARAVLIAGGRDKGGSYEPLASALRDKGRAAVLIGEARDAIAEAIGSVVPVRLADSLGDAVRVARSLARAGDAVLLSPACSSYDMFVDYKHRGDEFVRAVERLAAGREP